MILPPGEIIVENKKCRLSGQDFFVTDKDLEFYDKVSPVFGGKKYSIPSPTTSPYERMVQKFAWRNERNLYRRKCDLTHQDILSMYHPDGPYRVYSQEAWWSDSWSCFDSAININWDISFFDQFDSLMKRSPLMPLSVLHLENSEYNNCAGHLKNCYLCFDVDYLEDCYYLGDSNHSKDCMDGEIIIHSNYCYECFNCSKCNTAFFSTDCENCSYISFCHGCVGCSDCLFCFNQSRKKYCINDIQYSSEEYKSRKQDILSKKDYPEMISYFHERRRQTTMRCMHGINNESCTGDYLDHSKNTYNSFECQNLEDCKNAFYLFDSKNCQDCLIYGNKANYIYQCLATGLNINSCAFCSMCWDGSQNVYYSLNVASSKDCFGCVGIKKGAHCILNNVYSTHEYETLCGRLIDHMRSTGEWGEFFPMKHSPYGYNETVGMDYTPLSQEGIKSRGGKWIERERLTGEIGYLPKPILEYNEKVVGYETADKNIQEILGNTIICSESRRPFRIQKKELLFLIENSFPIPLFHPQIRHSHRIHEYRPGIILHERACAECGGGMSTTYSPDRPERVVCEECYRKIVY